LNSGDLDLLLLPVAPAACSLDLALTADLDLLLLPLALLADLDLLLLPLDPALLADLDLLLDPLLVRFLFSSPLA
jgi:hypothetical protein